ncbi:hypothetical protein Zm00014a_012539 [Zea mays]|uniref:KOW domain-containing protein n=1 Tax=Zea mays TaxID=4577 RepID=A0A3L6GEX4_MAIZE|nr:hypothetical protein Zm00014a_012539 [Zea mays]
MANIIRKCWDPNLDKRPDMDEVVRLLEALDTRKHGGMTPKGQAGGQGGNLLIDLFCHCDNHLGEKQVNNPFSHMSFPSLRQTRTTGCFRLHPIRDEDAKFKLYNGRSVQFDVGNVVMVTGGRNTGRVGVIKNWEKHKGIFEVIDVLLGAFCMLCLVFSYLLYRKT